MKKPLTLMQVVLVDAPKPMKIETLPNGARLVKRYKLGYCYGCVWSEDATDQQIRHDMAMGDAAFFPFDESTNQFNWSVSTNGKALRFRK